MIPYLYDKEDYFPMDDLQPGITYPYAIIFDVAPDATGFTLHLSESLDTIFNLGI